MKALLLIAAVSLLAVSATTAAIDRDTIPDEVKQDACWQKAILALRDATDPAKADTQEWSLRAADAYLRLSGMEATC